MRLLKLLLVLIASAVAAPAVADSPYRRAVNQIHDREAQDAFRSRDYATALRLSQGLAENGYAPAQTRLGFMYHGGLGVPRDYAAAAFWLRKAADQGDPIAPGLLQVMYLTRQMADEWKPTPPAASPKTSLGTAPTPRSSSTVILMKKDGGIYAVPVLINNAITLDFMVDSGASDVSIPEDVVTTLIRAGTIRDTDFIGERTYVLADGSRVQSKTFRIRTLKVGDRVLENVTGSVASTKGSLLLGQSFLGRFKSWSIDNNRHVLVLE